ncbi:MAG: FADH(2)-oxidizing methylenetetrahydrofolate--tRNA-(uracil(54)-C(5))-methyltransferase TrmFO [Limnochordia bacterium]
MQVSEKVTIIGGGLAGCEAAWQLVQRGIPVDLYEMRPEKMTPAHQTGQLAELVCSNSLGADRLDAAPGLLKAEMEHLGSLTLVCARLAQVPAGGALAVDREEFAQHVTRRLQDHPLVEIITEEVTELPPGVTIIASGPLTSPAFSQVIERLTGSQFLYFYDAAAPIVTRESIDEEAGFWASRYGRGSADYFNCPLTEAEYQHFWEQLVQAPLAPIHLEEEKQLLFEGCMPIEELARRGPQTLLFGPLKPVGLTDPRTGERPFAVVQLRKENRAGTLLNLVGFQTRLRWGAQREVFSLIPALRNAEFVRLGVMHRNTFIHSPRLLHPSLQLKELPRVFFAGQITGVEGYMESAATGILAGINAAHLLQGKEPFTPPPTTMLGALVGHITSAIGDFQPMNANFGLLPPLERRIRNKAQRKSLLAERALAHLQAYSQEG